MSTANPKEQKSIMACDFEIRGYVPKEAFELFAVAQAKIMGLRGYILQVAEDFYQGQLQGEGKVIETFKQALTTAGEFVAAIKEFIIKNLKAIEAFTYETFEIKKKWWADPLNSIGISSENLE